jgi:predicted transcriptional regulator
LKQAFHPRAFLSRKRNVRLGLTARTRILQALERRESDVKAIMAPSQLKYNVVIHHLRLLEAERVVVKKGGKKPYVWQLTGAGQQRLVRSSEE